jgi:hypothetical protein
VRQRIRKSQLVYRTHQANITNHWPAVVIRCSQAERFSNEVLAACPPVGSRAGALALGIGD